ncbi:hypothetical protein C8R43DRAFT_1032265 [Mycena crocata]|nr:hypothetical protein C8R43DRAFT_1032265 [Mycena crocata]
MRFTLILTAYVFCLVKVQPAVSRAISEESRSIERDEAMDKRSPIGVSYTYRVDDSDPERRSPLGGFGYHRGPPDTEDEESLETRSHPIEEKRSPLGVSYTYRVDDSDPVKEPIQA